jgi:hypothetical protein
LPALRQAIFAEVGLPQAHAAGKKRGFCPACRP